MAAPIMIACPECQKELKVPPEVAGKKIRCKGCGHIFVAKAMSAKSAPAKAAPGKAPPAKAADKPKPAAKPHLDDDDEDANPYGVTDLDLAPRCPNCANEMESAEAIICLFCGYNTQTREQARTRKTHDVTGGDQFVWLLPGILCVLGIIAWIVLDIVYCLKIDDWVDLDSWWGTALASGAIKLWLVITSLFFIYYLGKFAVKRLIFNPNPPEVEKH